MKIQKQKSKRQDKGVDQAQVTQSADHQNLHAIQIVKNNLPYFVLAVVVATAFFAHETLVNDYTAYNDANDYYTEVNNEKVEAWLKLEETIKENPLYQDYKEKELKSTEAYNTALAEYEKHKFLEFRSFQDFMNEFGWACGLFLYSMINLILAFIRKSETLIGRIVFHTTLVCVSLFFIRWCFMKQDFGQFTYIATNIVLALALSYSAYLFVRIKEKNYLTLKSIIRRLFDFIIIDTPDKIDQSKINEYKVEYHELISEVSDKF